MPERQKIRTPLAEIALYLRTLRGITTTNLAEQMNLDRPNLSAWFGGRPRVLSEANELKICAHLGWRFEHLSCAHVHMWRIAAAHDVELLLALLTKIAGTAKQRLIIKPIGFENTLAGHLLFVAQQGGEGTLIRLRRAGQLCLDIRSTIQTLGFGEIAPSHQMSDAEYGAIWRDESVIIRTNDYVERFLPDDGTASALEFDSRDWSTEAMVERSRSEAEDEGGPNWVMPGGPLESLIGQQHEVPQSASDEPEDFDPPTDREDWQRSKSCQYWLEFAWQCVSEGFSVQDAEHWKAQALK